MEVLEGTMIENDRLSSSGDEVNISQRGLRRGRAEIYRAASWRVREARTAYRIYPSGLLGLYRDWITSQLALNSILHPCFLYRLRMSPSPCPWASLNSSAVNHCVFNIFFTTVVCTIVLCKMTSHLKYVISSPKTLIYLDPLWLIKRMTSPPVEE